MKSTIKSRIKRSIKASKSRVFMRSDFERLVDMIKLGMH